MKTIRNYALLIFLTFSGLNSSAQLQVYSGFSAADYVNYFVGNGVTVTNPVITGNTHSFGAFLTGSTATNLGMQYGIVLSTGVVDGADIGGGAQPLLSAPVTDFASSTTNSGTDAQLQSLIPSYTINDATKLEFDFVPLSDTIKFRYVFGSEEYPEFVSSSYNDVFGFFISGVNPLGGNYSNYNIARVPNTNLPVTIDNINSGANATYYVDNQGLNGQTIVYDGFTKVLTAWAKVIPCSTYHFKIAIGDAGDAAFDSGVFLEQNSFSSPGVSVSTQYLNDTLIGSYALEGGCNDVTLCFSLTAAQTSAFTVTYNISGTATNGVDYNTIPSSLLIPAGQVTACQTISPILDNINEGSEFIKLILNSVVGCNAVNDTVIVEIKDYNVPIITTSNDTLICEGSANIWAQATGGYGQINYIWDNGVDTTAQTVTPLNTTTYVVSVTDYCGFTASNDVTVTVSQGVAEAGPDVAICDGFSTTLSSTTPGSYLWSTGETTQSIVVSPNSNTTYYLTVTGLCEGNDSVTVSVNPNPEISATLYPPIICKGDTIHLSATGAPQFEWIPNPVDYSIFPLLPDLSSARAKPQITTTYRVVGTDTNGCKDYDTVSVMVMPIPQPSFFTKPLYASSFDPTFHFYDNTQGNNTQWEWILGDGTTATGQDFWHTFPVDQFGEYEVYLVVTNEAGCFDTLKSSVLVRADYTLYIPNAFSPNGDGKNDYFNIYGLNMTDNNFSIVILDRWGKQVFYSTEPAFRWDGKIDGDALGQDVYNYILKYTAPDGNKYEKRGIVTLIGERKK